MRISKHVLKGIRDIYGPNNSVRVYAYVDAYQDFQFLALPLAKSAPVEHPRNPSYRLLGALDLKTGDVMGQVVQLPGTEEGKHTIKRERILLLVVMFLKLAIAATYAALVAMVLLISMIAGMGGGGHRPHRRHRR